MTDPQSDAIAIVNKQSISTLARAIAYSQGEFSLILARCNYVSLREQILQQLKAVCPVAIRELHLPAASTTLYTAIREELGTDHPDALMVFGLESTTELDTILTSTNQVREEFRKEFAFPIVLWINDTIQQKLIKLVPDLESWSTTIEFAIASDELVEFLTRSTEEIFTKIQTRGAGVFLRNDLLNLQPGSILLAELEFAQRDLQHQDITLEPFLEASLEFIAGKALDNSEQARLHYERSLMLWKQAPDPAKQGCVLFCLGLWWRSRALQQRSRYTEACLEAKTYYQQSIAAFRRADRPDLVVRFISALSEVLQRLEHWEELEAIATETLELTQTYPDLLRQARAHGFLAEVCLARSDWKGAKQSSETALQCFQSADAAIHASGSPNQLTQLEWARASHKGWYLLSLAQAQHQLEQTQAAIATLEQAKEETKPEYDPQLYIQILRTLRSLYFQQKDYRQAFNARLEYRSIEQQYGYRAFVGPGRLEPQKTVLNPALATLKQSGEVTQEIAASGRQQDVKRLIERISRSDQKLTVIHGQSGVGKSSILQAGLIPALNPIILDTREIVVILQQVYTNWTAQLGRNVLKALQRFERFQLPDALKTESEILHQLRQSIDQNLMAVLIFDQFEEFFFACTDPKDRKQFYEFLRDCLNIPYVKVILSLREDYLHYLLECNARLVQLDIIGNNILDKNILFYLGNFTPEDAKSVIQALTQPTRLTLEPDLIEALVKDLSQDLGEVRPIELQLVGSQLQTEDITTLNQYQQLQRQEQNAKDILIGRFLEEIIQDCGVENEQIARLVLYLLTDENLTRPLKTRADLALELEASERLDLVLDILVASRLVFKIPALPADRYQLVHDYLVLFIRQKQSSEATKLIAEIEKEREQRKLTEAKLNQALKQQLRAARRAVLTFAGMTIAIGGFAIFASLLGLNTFLSSRVTSSSKQTNQLERMVSALAVGRFLQQWNFAILPEIRYTALSELDQTLSNIRQVQEWEAHTEEITAVQFSPDSQLIVTASRDRTVRIWDITGLLKQELQHDAVVTSLSFSPDGTQIATGSEDGTIRIWNLDGTLVKELEGHEEGVTVLSFSPDGKRLASGSQDWSIKIQALDGSNITNFQEHSSEITNLTFSPDGTMLGSAARYDQVQIWDLVNNREILALEDSEGSVVFGFQPNNQGFFAINEFGIRRLYSAIGKPVGGNNYENQVWTFNRIAVAFSSNYELIASSIKNNPTLVYVGSKENRFIQGAPSFRVDDKVIHLRFSFDNRFLAVITERNQLSLWQLSDLNEEIQWNRKVIFSQASNLIFSQTRDVLSILWREGSLYSPSVANEDLVSISSDGQLFLTSTIESNIQVWSTEHGQVNLQSPNFSSLTTVAVSPQRPLVVAGDENGSIHLWQTNGQLLNTLPGHTKPVTEIIFSPDGNLFASRSEDNTVRLWQANGTLVGLLKGFSEDIRDIVFSPDNNFLVTIEENGIVKLWRNDGSLIEILEGEPISWKTVQFSPDSRFIAILSRGFFGKIDIFQTNGSQFTSINTGYILEFKFSPDSTILAAIASNDTIQFWQVDGIPLRPLADYIGQINDWSFNPTGNLIITAGEDGTVRIWNQDGTLALPPLRHDSEVESVSFSPDGTQIASVDRNNIVKIWNLQGQEILTLSDKNIETDSSQSVESRISFSPDGETIVLTSKLWSNSTSNSREIESSIFSMWDREGQEIYSLEKQSFIDWVIAFTTQSSTLPIIAFIDHRQTLNLKRSDGNLFSTLSGYEGLVNSVAFSLNGDMIATANDDKTVRIWEQDGSLLRTIDHADRVNSVSFSPDGEMIATASDDRIVRLYHLDGTLIRELTGHSDRVTSVLFSPDGQTLASAGNNSIYRWRLTSDEPIEQIPLPSGFDTEDRDMLDALSFSDDGNLLALGKEQVYVRFLNGMAVREATFTALTEVPEGGFPPDNQMITVTGNSGTLVLNIGLDDLLTRSCDWIRNYLQINPNVTDRERRMCDDP